MPLGSGKGQILWTERRSFFNDVFTAYFCIRENLQQQLKINRKYTACFFECTINCPRYAYDPQSTFFNDVFIIYPCMRRPSCTAIKDKPRYTSIKRWLDTMNILHKRISDDILL